ncbi:hypothetical protein BGX38DRAFT_1275898 [Terfezia claveryi]|nr:hypothetical protein BGX38DRAFT_1275898 [Terfezia claveryi]
MDFTGNLEMDFTGNQIPLNLVATITTPEKRQRGRPKKSEGLPGLESPSDSSTIVPIQGPSMIVPIPGPSTIVPSMEDYDDSPIASLDSNNYSNSQQTNLRNRSAPNERQMELNELNQQQLENRNFPTVDLTGIIDDNSDDMDGMDNNTGQNENLNRFTEEDNTDAVLERTTLNAIQFLAQQLVFGHGCTTEEHTEWQEGLEADRAGEVENQAENVFI